MPPFSFPCASLHGGGSDRHDRWWEGGQGSVREGWRLPTRAAARIGSPSNILDRFSLSRPAPPAESLPRRAHERRLSGGLPARASQPRKSAPLPPTSRVRP